MKKIAVKCYTDTFLFTIICIYGVISVKFLLMNSDEEKTIKGSYKDQPYYTDDIFQESELPTADFDDLSPQITQVMPKWLDETRLVSFLVGVFGLIYTIFNLSFLSLQISNPFFLNLTILLGLAGFLNFMLYPNVLKYCLVNGIRNQGLLRSMNGFMTGFSALLLVFLFSFPITGLGLSLILIPAPIIYGYYSRKYIDQTYRGVGVRFSVLTIFDQDLKRIAWFSFTLIFLTLVLAFIGLFMGII